MKMGQWEQEFLQLPSQFSPGYRGAKNPESGMLSGFLL